MKRIAIAAGLAACALTLAGEAVGATDCTGGTYNTRLTATGGCAWGNFSGDQSYKYVSMVVKDTKVDRCVYLNIDRRIPTVIGAVYEPWGTGKWGRVCTSGSTNVVQTAVPRSALSNAVRIRVCQDEIIDTCGAAKTLYY